MPQGVSTLQASVGSWVLRGVVDEADVIGVAGVTGALVSRVPRAAWVRLVLLVCSYHGFTGVHGHTEVMDDAGVRVLRVSQVRQDHR